MTEVAVTSPVTDSEQRLMMTEMGEVDDASAATEDVQKSVDTEGEQGSGTARSLGRPEECHSERR